MSAAPFRGAKAALLARGRVVVLRRDDIPGIAWPGALDLPGGARDSGEAPEANVLREIREETGLALNAACLVWRRRYTNPDHVLPSWMFAARLSGRQLGELQLGDEGQWLGLMPVSKFLAAPDAIPHLKRRLTHAVVALRRPYRKR